ncbi:MAG: ABC transporter ATP-binding protein [bacterium]
MSLLELKNVSYAYTQKASDSVLKNLSFSVPSFKRVALLGPNGSGKSTAFKVLSTQLHGWSGEIFFDGKKLKENESYVRSQLGVCFQSPSLDKILTGRENLLLHARVLGMDTEEAIREINSLAQKLRVTYIDKRVAEMSGGQARRIEIIKAFLGKPQLLLLDEPTNGLDPQARKDFWEELRSVSQEKKVTVLVTTHLIEEAEQCEELIFMSEGVCVGHGSPAVLRSSLGFEVLQIEVLNVADRFLQLKAQLLPSEKAEIQLETIRVSTPRAQELFDELRKAWGQDIQRIEWSKPNLADVYFEKTGKALK